MAYVHTLVNRNFLEYASYVIKDRAIPHLDDGFKPVQRRIIHSLFEMDDGKFHKVANVVGHCMQYHPHGDASIYSALVVLANKELLIEKQGNFGNLLTGDEPSAARYIECRLHPLAAETLLNPELTSYEPSYDGRRKEPTVFPAKLPYVLLLGAEGIAVGMSTRILPHNLIEVIDAMRRCLQGERFALYPDFHSGGLVDIGEYEDGHGRIRSRARLDTSDSKRIVVRELAFGSTTESLIDSVEQAARKNKVKIAGISDFTSEEVEIEIKLARGVYASDVIDSLFAFTECETQISVNLLVIRDERPVAMTVTEVVEYHAEHLVAILKAELELEQSKLNDTLHARTLERIFIEERIYKEIEQQTTHEAVFTAVRDGLAPFVSKLRRKVSDEDIERLLRIPIRRISLYDINRAKKEMEEIKARLNEIKGHLKALKSYAIGFLDRLEEQYAPESARRAELSSFRKVEAREVVGRNLTLRYDKDSGYLGHGLSNGRSLFNVSPYDRVLVIRSGGTYSVMDVPEKLFVDKRMLYCGLADKDELAKVVFTVVYRISTGEVNIKRCRIEKYILDKAYQLVPEEATIVAFSTRERGSVTVRHKKKPQLRKLEDKFELESFAVKGQHTQGVRLTNKEITSVKIATT